MMANIKNGSDASIKIASAKDLGLFVQQFRSSQKITQADISGMANTGNRFIVELEHGKETVQFKKVLDVLDTLGLEMIIQRKGGN